MAKQRLRVHLVFYIITYVKTHAFTYGYKDLRLWNSELSESRALDLNARAKIKEPKQREVQRRPKETLQDPRYTRTLQ